MAARLTTYLVVAIVATTLIAGLIVGAQREDNDGPVDLIVHNAVVYTAGGERARAGAIAIRGNQILRVGDEQEIARLRRAQTIMIDAAGAAVLPGFNDAHAHVMAGGLALDRIDLAGSSTLEEIDRRIRAWTDANPDSTWVLGRGWDDQSLRGMQPTRELLDAIVPDRPVQLISRDGRSSWVNSAALRVAGIARGTPNPPGGTIVRDARTGRATGILRGAAVRLVGSLTPPPARDDQMRALGAAIDEAHAHGITSLQNATGHAEEFALFAEARRAGDLNVRLYSALSIDGEFTNADRAQLLNAGRQYPDDPLFKSGAVKIEIDGGSPDQDRPAAVGIDRDDLNRSARLIDAEGWQIMAHAASPRGVDMALDAYQHAARSNEAPDRGRRHRVEHAAALAPVASRFAALGVLASLQPTRAFALRLDSAGGVGEPPLRVVHPDAERDRANTGAPAENMPAARVRVAFGSDWPDGPIDPLQGIRAAVRQMAKGSPSGDEWSAQGRRALEYALDAYTSGAAWASFDEQRKGTLAPGMLADLVVLSEDIFDTPSRLANARVEITIFDGRVVYRRARGTD